MDNIGLMSETVNFIQGSKRNYDSSTMQGGVYFSKDSKEIFLNGESYGNAVPADEEDLTSVNGSLHLKDREVNADNFQSKGYVILRKNLVQQEDDNYKNILTQDMINQPNTIYEIRYDFDLNGGTINLPDNCILNFKGGILYNGTITAKNNTFIYSKGLSFQNINLLNVQQVYINWFVESLNDDVSDLINNLSNNSNTIIFDSKTYTCKKPIILRNNTNLIGNFATLIIDTIKFEASNNISNFNIKNYGNKSRALLDISSKYVIKDYVKINIDNINFYNNEDCDNIDLISMSCGDGIEGFHTIKISNIRSEGDFRTGITLKQEGNIANPWITDVLVIDCFFYDIANAVKLEQLKYDEPNINMYQNIRFIRVESQFGSNSKSFFTITGSQRLFVNDCTCWDIPKTHPQYIFKDKYVRMRLSGDFVDINAQLYINDQLQTDYNIYNNIIFCENLLTDSYISALPYKENKTNKAPDRPICKFVNIDDTQNRIFGNYYTSYIGYNKDLTEYILGISNNRYPAIGKKGKSDDNFNTKIIYSQAYFPYSYANSRPKNPVRGQIDFDCLTWLPIIYSDYNGMNRWVNTDGIPIDEKCFATVVTRVNELKELNISSRGFKCFVTDLNRWCIWTGSRWETQDNHSPKVIRGTTENRPNIEDWDKGFCYFDTTLNKPIWWTGTKWVDSIGIDADSGSWTTIE